MVAVLAPVEKTRIYTPVWLGARFTVSRGTGRRQYRRMKVNRLSVLWPESQLRKPALDFARRFVDDMRSQGYELLTAEADVVLTGPFPPRDYSGQRTQRHHIRGGGDVTVLPVNSQTIGENNSSVEDYVLEAEFLSSRVRLVEHAVKGSDNGRS